VNWRIVSASVVGTAHQSRNEICQDCHIAVNWKGADEKESLIALVADGAGSAQFAKLGAELACQEGKCLLEELLATNHVIPPTHEDIQKLIRELSSRINHHANIAQVPIREYACTLLIALIHPQFSLFAQIGDGGIVVAQDSVFELIFWPDNGEYANETHFLTDSDAVNYLQFLSTETHYSEIALFSDGLQRLALLYENRSVYTPFFTPMLTVIRQSTPELCTMLSTQLAAFLSSSRINERTDDDKTLVLASYTEN